MTRIVNLENFQQFTAINVLTDPGHIGGPVVIPNSAKVMLVWTMPDGKTARNILGGAIGGSFAFTAANAEAGRAALVNGANWSALAAFLAPTASLTAVELLDIRTPANTAVRSTGAATPGTSVGTALPSEVAVVGTLRTGRTGPANRGRVYVPGWATNALASGDVVAAAAVTALQAWFNGNVGIMFQTIGASWVLLQPARAAYTGSTGTQHPARAATTTPITSVSVRNNTWDSQRRRGLK